MNIIAMIPELIAHGFTFPRITPLPPELDDLEPSEEHPNEFLSPQDLAEARMAEIVAEEEEELDKLIVFYKEQEEGKLNREPGKANDEKEASGQVEWKPTAVEDGMPSRVVWVTGAVVNQPGNQTAGNRTAA